MLLKNCVGTKMDEVPGILHTNCTFFASCPFVTHMVVEAETMVIPLGGHNKIITLNEGLYLYYGHVLDGRR